MFEVVIIRAHLTMNMPPVHINSRDSVHVYRRPLQADDMSPINDLASREQFNSMSFSYGRHD